MATCGNVQTPFRRPCLLRATVESDVDAPAGKRATALLPEGEGARRWPMRSASAADVSTRGASAPDYRAITLDMPGRLTPRCSGLHKGGFAAPPEYDTQPKYERLRTLQGLGIENSNIDLVMSRGRPACSLGWQRTRIEELNGLPVAGQGADLELCRGRRCDGLRGAERRESTPLQDKAAFDSTSIDHQFRRHFSAPPETRFSPSEERSCARRGDFEHSVRAETYAGLIGRPEGMGKRSKQAKSTAENMRSRRPFRIDRGFKDSLFPPLDSPMASPRSAGSGGGVRCEHDAATWAAGRGDLPFPADCIPSLAGIPPLAGDAPAQSAALIAALREATRNTPAEAVWDAMLTALAETPELFGPKATSRPAHGDVPPLSMPGKVSAVLAAAASGENVRAAPAVSPFKNRKGPDESPRKHSPGRNSRGPMGRNASEHSLMSVSTTADTEGCGSKSGGGSLSVTSASPGGSLSVSGGGSLSVASASGRGARPPPRPRHTPSCRAAEWLREERWKAKRRASWVA